MQKRLLVAAVASALAAPGIVLAAGSGSTVQIYGRAVVEHARLDQGSGRPKTDYFEVTGSYIGFKGTEALGGGMSAWFQCETTMDLRGIDQTGLCSRNSGLGVRGGFGNLWAGRWHTPMSRAIALGAVGAEATGNFGVSQITGGTGSTSIMRNSTGYDTGNNGSSENRTRFRRRETCLTTYETPNFSGFMVGAAVSCGNKAAEADASNQNNDKPRVWSLAGTYRNGPLALGVAYEKHLNLGAFSPTGPKDLDDRGWGLSARYRIGSVTLGGFYMDRKWDNVDGDVKVKGGHVGVSWRIAGPHQLEAAYAMAGDSKGSSAFGVGQGSGSAGGQGGGGGYSGATNPIAAPGSNTGTQGWTLGYSYHFSKRTFVKFAYTYVDNDRNTDGARLFTAADVNKPGENQSSIGMIVKHRF